MRLPSDEIVFTEIEREFPQLDVDTVAKLTDWAINFADKHRELDDWEKVTLYAQVVRKDIGGDHTETCARLLGWDYKRAANAFMAAKALGLVEEGFDEHK